MKDATQLHIRPARPDEAGLFYTPHPEEDKRLGTVGHVRMDFGRSGNEFWHTWWPRGPEELNSPAFKLELQEVVDTLRESVLKNRFAMERFCYEHGEKISGGWVQNYGYIVETEHYRYCLRCNPSPGDYNCYCTAYDLDVQRQNMARDKPLVGRVTYANGDTQEFTDAESFLECVREELPYRPTTGFRYEVLTDDPVVRKQVDDISETGQGREKHGDVTVLFSALSVESGAVRRKGETMNIRKAVDYFDFRRLNHAILFSFPRAGDHAVIKTVSARHSVRTANGFFSFHGSSSVFQSSHDRFQSHFFKMSTIFAKSSFASLKIGSIQ